MCHLVQLGIALWAAQFRAIARRTAQSGASGQRHHEGHPGHARASGCGMSTPTCAPLQQAFLCIEGEPQSVGLSDHIVYVNHAALSSFCSHFRATSPTTFCACPGVALARGSNQSRVTACSASAPIWSAAAERQRRHRFPSPRSRSVALGHRHKPKWHSPPCRACLRAPDARRASTGVCLGSISGHKPPRTPPRSQSGVAAGALPPHSTCAARSRAISPRSTSRRSATFGRSAGGCPPVGIRPRRCLCKLRVSRRRQPQRVRQPHPPNTWPVRPKSR